MRNSQFHSRFSAKERTYLYLIINDYSPSMINQNREWNIRNKLDINLMKKGAKNSLEHTIFPLLELQIVVQKIQSEQ